MISVIIPVYNEENVLREQLDYLHRLSEHVQLIVVDGGSTDQTLELLKDFSTVVQSVKGRAAQMNMGAKLSDNNILLFLHADTRIQFRSLKNIEGYVKDGYVGGCLSQVIDEDGWLYRWIAFTGNLRAKLTKVFYGDQGIFVLKDVFNELKGFPELEICEDVCFSKMLRKRRKVKIFNDPIFCSARRWVNQGIIKTYWINLRVKTGLMLNHNQKQLVSAYRDVR